MSGTQLFSSARATLVRWTRLVPGLFRHDPLFRYASIAAVLALILFTVSVGQHVAGPVAVTGAGGKTGPAAKKIPESGGRQGSADRADGAETAEPPAPGSPGAPSATKDVTPISPGRALDHLQVEPASRDSFGTMP
jgi:hypothetical protein